MRHLFLLGTLLLVPIPPSFAGNQVSYFEECDRYEIKEIYRKGRYDQNGNYVRGKVTSRRHRLPCRGSNVEISHYPHHHYPAHHSYPSPSPYPYPQQQPQQNVQNPQQVIVPVQQNQCQGKLVKMGLGGLVGGGLGYLGVGGRKSNKTIIGTSLGVLGGSLLGRSLC
jgi:hypothetical protein